MKNDDDARALAKAIVMTVNHVSIKFGRTNGHPVLHVLDRKLKQSYTIASKAEWNLHPANPHHI